MTGEKSFSECLEAIQDVPCDPEVVKEDNPSVKINTGWAADPSLLVPLRMNGFNVSSIRIKDGSLELDLLWSEEDVAQYTE